MSSKDLQYLNRCLQLASYGLGTTYPNPLVGAVLVYEDTIIGEGFHYKAGEPHAEVVAIANVKDKSLLPKSTLYVNLEPCNHQGKTPACTSLILKEKIKRVVIAGIDENPLVNGKGVENLQANGVEVKIEKTLVAENQQLNRRFFTFHQKKRPYIILKYAQSADGYIDGNEDKPIAITNRYCQQLVHKWRTEEQAILVGKNTVLKDNPRLNARSWIGPENIKIIIDSGLSIPRSYKIYQQDKLLVFNYSKTEKHHNIEYIKIENKSETLEELFAVLYQKEIQSIIIEGGKFTLDSFIYKNLWDEARIFTNPELVISQGTKAPLLPHNAELLETVSIQGNLLQIYKNTLP